LKAAGDLTAANFFVFAKCPSELICFAEGNKSSFYDAVRLREEKANKTGPQCPQPFLAFCYSPSPYGVSWQIAIQHRIVELPEESMCHRILQAFWSSLGKHLQTEAI